VGDDRFNHLSDDDEEMPPRTLHDQICRMCKQHPHTDAHILLECTAHPEVVELRRTHLAQNDRELCNRGSFDELFEELKGSSGRCESHVLLGVGDRRVGNIRATASMQRA
jgi:hypothetical protein